MNFTSRIYLLLICIDLCLIGVVNHTIYENEAKVNTFQNNHRISKHTLRVSPSILTSEKHEMDSLNLKKHECTSEQMLNLDWPVNEVDGFLCGPKSVVNGYSVTILPKGMHFYHGSKTLPHGVIPGGETNGMQQIKKKLLGCLLLVNMEKK